jgi:hypothetical protein
MRIFSTSGSFGDSFITLVKIWNLAKEEQIQVNHYTTHYTLWDKIKEIYSLCPYIKSNFVFDRDYEHTRIHSDFVEKDDIELEIDPFPEFNLPKSLKKFNLNPKEYGVLVLAAGKDNEKHRCFEGDLGKMLKNHDYNKLVIIGTRSTTFEYAGSETIIDLTGKTSLFEAFDIIRNAESFIGIQGLMAFFAMSQKIPAEIYYRTLNEKNAVLARTHDDWKKYLVKLDEI